MSHRLGLTEECWVCVFGTFLSWGAVFAFVLDASLLEFVVLLLRFGLFGGL